jgi:flagellar basal-body rod protein FlgB
MNQFSFEDSTMRLMERFLDLSVQRQSLVSSNVANVDTPAYKTVDIDFEHELLEAAEGHGLSIMATDPHHLGNRQGRESASPGEVEGLTLRNDLNNVNIDREMAQLSTNALKFSMVAQLIAGKFRTLKNAINEGR